jgi:hypothetical protein
MACFNSERDRIGRPAHFPSKRGIYRKRMKYKTIVAAPVLAPRLTESLTDSLCAGSYSRW